MFTFKDMKFVVLTSTGLRHKKFAQTMCERFSVEHVIFEDKELPKKLADKEHKYFEDCVNWEPEIFTKCGKGKINSKQIEKILLSIGPDYILVFGCSLLKSNIFNIPKFGCLNIHTGMTEYYRGVDSHLWAIMDERLDRIGSTVHFVDESIDAGEVIAQYPLDNIEFMDDLDDVFLKNCELGFRIMETVVQFLPNPPMQKIVKKGKLYQNKDRNTSVMNQAERKLFKMLMERK